MTHPKVTSKKDANSLPASNTNVLNWECKFVPKASRRVDHQVAYFKAVTTYYTPPGGVFPGRYHRLYTTTWIQCALVGIRSFCWDLLPQVFG